MTIDPMQVLDVLADVLREHMDAGDALPEYRVARVLPVARSDGPVVMMDDVLPPATLLLTMRDGSQFKLTLEHGVTP